MTAPKFSAPEPGIPAWAQILLAIGGGWLVGRLLRHHPIGQALLVGAFVTKSWWMPILQRHLEASAKDGKPGFLLKR
jgi:hypothetical protein